MDSPQSVVLPFKNSVVAEPENLTPKFSGGNAGDIHNICIYHKQDVYAKLCLTSDPESTVSTKIINGGGRNPVFNDNLRLDVRTIDSSLKIEIFMMSRVRNYLEDQLLGFALVPLSEVLLKNGKLEKEFSLSSTDLFHSPAAQSDSTMKPVVSVNIEPEQKLAKMKLPLDIDSRSTKSESSSTTDQKIQASKNTGSRVFYGSRAFF
ncbi:mitochondrial import inner membrane translocase subunit TIM22-2-like [Hibiscus syriacus]|uniref:Mitochondrial import inner membrane translocase subunit TIM22-2-like n=1 Tax=Hibiscus syriacus TaxID=106335 RepID=A0A6A3D047_HIBSY|nr:mitochondrial import inner membrane translocase subunit TIM22-2-like [Hibiscus syriacus]